MTRFASQCRDCGVPCECPAANLVRSRRRPEPLRVPVGPVPELAPVVSRETPAQREQRFEFGAGDVVAAGVIAAIVGVELGRWLWL